MLAGLWCMHRQATSGAATWAHAASRRCIMGMRHRQGAWQPGTTAAPAAAPNACSRGKPGCISGGFAHMVTRTACDYAACECISGSNHTPGTAAPSLIPLPTPSLQEDLSWPAVRERYVRPYYLPGSFIAGALTLGLRTSAANFVFADDVSVLP